MKIKELKQELKQLSQEIKTGKSQRKGSPNGFVPGLWSDRRNFRIKHIAYCLARGRTMEQIENKVSEDNRLTSYETERITKLVEELKAGYSNE